MYSLNIYNDNESVDLDFFDGAGGQIKLYANGTHKDCSQIVTKAVIETHPETSYKDSVYSKDLKSNQILNSSDTTKMLKDANYLSSSSPSLETIMTENPNMEKSLSNCLAYANEISQEKGSRSIKFDDRECSDNSLSDSTITTITSDLTSVSPFSSMSDSSYAFEESSDSSTSESKSESVDDCIETKHNGLHTTDECNLKLSWPKSEGTSFCDHNLKDEPYDENLYCPGTAGGNVTKDIETDLPLDKECNISVLEEELGDICLSGQSTSTSSTFLRSPVCRGTSKTKMRKKESNLTFNREEIIKIERDNLILLKKIMAHSKPRSVSLNRPFTHKKTSAAINRARQQKKIEQDNYILYSKISAVGRMKKVF